MKILFNTLFGTEVVAFEDMTDHQLDLALRAGECELEAAKAAVRAELRSRGVVTTFTTLMPNTTPLLRLARLEDERRTAERRAEREQRQLDMENVYYW